MRNCEQTPNLFISVSGANDLLDTNAQETIYDTFDKIFGNSCSKIYDIKVDNHIEIVYEIKAPIITNNELIENFYDEIKQLLKELSDFNPHFTQHKTIRR